MLYVGLDNLPQPQVFKDYSCRFSTLDTCHVVVPAD
jgi:hypothetical protein